ncbi:MAG: hypothetical protein JNM88_17820 [Chitinophagaceae bacterium]|nr:hypothetical protein [Chitinophagaceae bacterium]
MKQTIGIMGGIVLAFVAVSVNAQDTTRWNPRNNPTVDSIVSPYQSKMITTKAPLTTTDIFPVIGRYESATNTEATQVNVSLDEQNKGIVWVEGLPQGKVKAMLRKSPAIYKIPAQKTEEGKDVPEGTLIFDKETNTLSICLGKSFVAEDPASVFATPVPEEQPATVKTSKQKSQKPAQPKTWIYTGTKQVKETVMN